MLVWIDLETTGLFSPRRRILECCVIITDDHLYEVARFTRVLNWIHAASMLREDDQVSARLVNVDVDPVVRQMHLDNGLWRESAASVFGSLHDLDAKLCSLVESHCGTDLGAKTGPLLAGNSVHFDREFLKRDLVGLHSRLNYRNLDVSTIAEFAHRFWPEIAESAPPKSTTHRAEADCVNAIELAKHYVKCLGPVVSRG